MYIKQKSIGVIASSLELECLLVVSSKEIAGYYFCEL